MINWIKVEDQHTIPKDKTIIVEDENGWIGQAYYQDSEWLLETFNQTSRKIIFSNIIKYLIIN